VKRHLLKTFFLIGSVVLAGCAESSRKTAADARPAPLSAEAQTGNSAAGTLPTRPETPSPPAVQTRMSAFEGMVKAIHHSSRRVTFLLADGKRVTVKVGAWAGNLSALQVGDLARFELAETAEIVRNHFHPESGMIVMEHIAGSAKEREGYNAYYDREVHASGKHNELSWSETIEIPARVVSFDAGSRTITLKSLEGRVFSVHMAQEILTPGEHTPGEPVAVRFKEVDGITVITPR
jgi:hypothetical protein